MSRSLDDNMVVDCREGEKSPTTTCQHSSKPIATQKKGGGGRKGGSQSRKPKMNRTEWFPRVLLV